MTPNPHPDPLPSRRERGDRQQTPSPPSFGGEGQDEGASRKPIDWRRWTLIVVLSVAAGFILHQARSALTDRPPFWLKTTTIKGPRLETGDPTGPLKRFRQLLDDARQQARQLRASIGPVQLYEVRRGDGEVVVWNVERFVNRGFDPQRRFQHVLGVPIQQLIGYYMLDGKPIPAVVRELTRLPGQTANIEMTVPAPVPPGGELFVIRLERGAKPVVSPHTGNYYLSLSYLPSTNAGIACRAIQLPKGAGVVRYAPSEVAWVVTEGAPAVAWQNSQLPSKAPAPSLTFTLPP